MCCWISCQGLGENDSELFFHTGRSDVLDILKETREDNESVPRLYLKRLLSSSNLRLEFSALSSFPRFILRSAKFCFLR